MAHRPLTTLLVAAGLALGSFGLYGCANEQSGEAKSPAVPADNASFDPVAKWGRFHSARFELSIGLPDGHDWKIDDHTEAGLSATHAATASRVRLQVFEVHDLTNRRRCQAEAEARGIVPAKLELVTVDASDEIRSDGFDTHVRVAVEAAKAGATASAPGPLRGHVLAFGSKEHRCFAFHFATEVAAGRENELSDRLALAATRMVKSISFDDGMTEPDPSLPRAKH